MRHCTGIAVPFWISLACAGVAPLANAEPAAFQLGEVKVSASRDDGKLDPVGTQVPGDDMERFGRNTVSQAINLLPGVAFSTNMRNEQTISVRGFDGRRTPLFLDGIPVYVPYDGQVDFSRFLTFDLAEIEVAKGFSSVAYGPNTMGGAINLVTRRPRAELEANVLAGFASGNERKLAANLGSNQGTWYVQVGASHVDADSYRLSGDFTPTSLQGAGHRNNADYQDEKFSLKLGLTPGGGNEYAIGLSSQRADKGQPPNVNPKANPLNFWRWPGYDKDSLYFIADQSLGDLERVKLRVFKDDYAYQLACFSNASYNVGKNCQFGTPVAPVYFLDDSVTGASLVLESRRIGGHVIRAAFHTKTDTHDEHTTGAVTTYRDRTKSLGIEDTVRLTDQLDLAIGVSRDSETALTSGNYGNPADQDKTNAQAGLFYLLGNGTQLYATLARKSRFPSIKERFSQQVGTQGGMLNGIANPDLQAETAFHKEIGLRTRYADWTLEAALFHARISDSIQSVTFVSAGKTFGQLQNVGEAVNQGVELSANWKPGSALSVGGNYTYLARSNVSNPAVLPTDTPRNKLFAYVDWLFFPGTRVVASLDAENGRAVLSAVDKSAYLRAAGFVSLSLKLAQSLGKGLTFEVGATNLTDRNIQLMDGLPLPGRTLFANLNFRL